MKKSALLLFACILALAACREIEKLTEFNMRYSSNVTIAKSTALNLPITLFTPEMETNSTSEFSANNTRKDLVEEIRLTKLVLTITSPEAQTFSFLNEITLYLSAEGMEEVEVAHLKDIPKTVGQRLELEPTGQDLKEYIKKDKFSLHVKTVTDEAISQDVDIAIASTFFVNAKVLGL